MKPALDSRYFGDAFRIVRGADIRGSPERLVLVFQCYLDDSGTSGLPIITMAGFVAALNQWEIAEPALDAVLNSYGVDVLHTKQFHDTKGPFEKWTRIKKRSFVEELFSSVHGRMLGVSMTIRKKPYYDEQKTGRMPADMSPYCVCFSGLMTKLVMDSQIGRVLLDEGVAFLVETGNKNNDELERFFAKMSKFENWRGCLRSLSFISKTNCRAIQIADFLAFYSRRHMREHDRFSGKFSLPMSAYLEIMQRHVPIRQWGAHGLLSKTRLSG